MKKGSISISINIISIIIKIISMKNHVWPNAHLRGLLRET